MSLAKDEHGVYFPLAGAESIEVDGCYIVVTFGPGRQERRCGPFADVGTAQHHADALAVRAG